MSGRYGEQLALFPATDIVPEFCGWCGPSNHSSEFCQTDPRP